MRAARRHTCGSSARVESLARARLTNPWHRWPQGGVVASPRHADVARPHPPRARHPSLPHAVALPGARLERLPQRRERLLARLPELCGPALHTRSLCPPAHLHRVWRRLSSRGSDTCVAQCPTGIGVWPRGWQCCRAALGVLLERGCGGDGAKGGGVVAVGLEHVGGVCPAVGGVGFPDVFASAAGTSASRRGRKRRAHRLPSATPG